MKESLISALDFRCVGKMHRSPEDETSGVYVMTEVNHFLPLRGIITQERN